jgi:hypothetical protein
MQVFTRPTSYSNPVSLPVRGHKTSVPQFAGVGEVVAIGASAGLLIGIIRGFLPAFRKARRKNNQ